MQVRLGAPFCRELEIPLKELERLIPLAKNAGVDTSSAQAVYDDLNGYLVYVPLIGDQCEKNTKEAQATVVRLQQAIIASGAPPPPEPLRPDYTDPTYVVTGSDVAAGVHDPEKQLVPSWVKWSVIAGASALLLMQVVPIVRAFAPRRLAGYRRRRRSR